VTLRRLASHIAGLTVHGFRLRRGRESPTAGADFQRRKKPANTAPIRVDFVPGSDEAVLGPGRHDRAATDDGCERETSLP